jgi:hypothetical protein
MTTGRGIARAFLLLPLPFFLCGCDTLTGILEPPYLPEPIRIYDKVQYADDVVECQAAGVAYKPHFSIGAALNKTVNGATANTSLIPISPLVPVYGAAGGLAGAASDGFDVMSAQHNNVYRNCLRDEVRRDGSAIIADPRN